MGFGHGKWEIIYYVITLQRQETTQKKKKRMNYFYIYYMALVLFVYLRFHHLNKELRFVRRIESPGVFRMLCNRDEMDRNDKRNS